MSPLAATSWPARVVPPIGAAAVWRVDLEPGADHARARLTVHARAAEALAACLGVSESRVRIAHRPGSAPETNIPGWTLSLSYARSIALIALGHGIRVGIDVVALDDLGDAVGLARDCLDDVGDPAHAPDRASTLAARWAEMEALMKCRGAMLREERGRSRPTLEAVAVPAGWVARLAWLSHNAWLPAPMTPARVSA
jgi:hypothetical protein